jgi:hypothetical protein
MRFPDRSTDASLSRVTRRFAPIVVLLLVAGGLLPFRPIARLAYAADLAFTPRYFSRDDSTYGVATGDFNADGALDIVAGNYEDQDIVYLNDGRGAFPVARPLGVVDNTSSVAVGDLNGDGALDIVIGNDGEQSRIYLNDGMGNFPSSRPALRRRPRSRLMRMGRADMSAGSACQNQHLKATCAFGSRSLLRDVRSSPTTRWAGTLAICGRTGRRAVAPATCGRMVRR